MAGSVTSQRQPAGTVRDCPLGRDIEVAVAMPYSCGIPMAAG
jgi:hypothetical protein